MPRPDPFGARASLGAGLPDYWRLAALGDRIDLESAPITVKILLENTLRHVGGGIIDTRDVETLASWRPGTETDAEIPFMPARVLLQDFTGVPAIVDLAAMRDAMADLGGDPARVNPLVPADLVIDHSVQVDMFGTPGAFAFNVAREYDRNGERYQLLRWAQTAFRDLRVVPPGTGIVHQVNLEYLATVVADRPDPDGDGRIAVPDTVVGTDSHTTMINGLGVVGWGVGGIEAEACMLGQPATMLLPQVVGFKMTGKLPEGATATDLVLTVTQMLRKKGVVGKFVEFYGDGLEALSLADRATISNMAPEYGATIGVFPIDEAALEYLRLTNRPQEQIDLVEAYAREQGLFRIAGAPEPVYSDTLSLDLAAVVPSLAGPKRPQDRINLPDVKKNFLDGLGAAPKTADIKMNGTGATIHDGSVVIAAITSCTNTSNPSVLVAAGLVAKKAVERGLTSKPWVKTSLAPGSKVVMDYLSEAGLLPALEALKFNLVGYGCTTCIGNSGPLPEEVAAGVTKEKLTVAAVLSGNRNFEGRVNPLVKANYLASPPLVVAYAIAGRVDMDLTHEPLGQDPSGKDVFLRDIWPSNQEVQAAVKKSVHREMFAKQYAEVFEGDAAWRGMKVPAGDLYVWDDASTYIKRAPYFDAMVDPKTFVKDLQGLRALAMLGDSVTTDHISPAGNIAKDSPAAQYLMSLGVKPGDFNSYGARRGNHEVMVRGTFANIRLRNQMAPGTEGGWTRHVPSGEQMSIYDASVRYQKEDTPLFVIAGKEYGTGSSRDWAAKGTLLLGVKAVIAESFERIHRSNLVGMGVLPLQFAEGETRESLCLTGQESFSIEGIPAAVDSAGKTRAKVTATLAGSSKTFEAIVRIDTPQEAEYYRSGGILPYVLRQLSRTGP